MRDVLARAEREGVAVTLHVESWNPARRLYERLGFASVGEPGAHELMRVQLKTAS
jgi:ribosomal protein S18 acetylase RimI-like enzyme